VIPAHAPVVLLVEDEPAIADFVKRGLESEGFRVEAAADGVQGQERALRGGVDLVLLDLMLPGRDGLAVLKAIHGERPALPVIAVTARGAVDDRVAALDGGAVDYVVKPFALSELAARVRAQLRAGALAPSTTVCVGDIVLDLLTRRVERAGTVVHLSNTEFELLACLMRNHGRVLTRAQLLREVWGMEHDPQTNVVDVYIGYLRRKLGRTGGRVPITTLRSVGYRMDDVSETSVAAR
jgi:DNA-binding response OmpR family regulator